MPHPLALAVLIVGLSLLVPGSAVAAEAGHPAPDWTLLGLQILNTVILGIILVRVARKPLAGFLKSRSETIGARIRDAEAGLAQARNELAEARARLSRHEEEAEGIRDAAQIAAEAERERGRARAQQASEHIRDEARAVADQEIERARRALRREAAELAVRLAADLLRENLRPEDDARIVSEFTSRVSGRGGATSATGATGPGAGANGGGNGAAGGDA